MYYMPVAKKKGGTRETLNIRIPAQTRSLIDRAAAARGTNRTDFILEAAARAAEDTLLERALISVSADAFAKFLGLLEAPARGNDKLRRTMQADPPWNDGKE